MQDKLGRPLKRNEVVHHINGDINDNRIENLQLMTLKEHSRLHRKGTHLSEETRMKLSENHKGIPNYCCRKLTDQQALTILQMIASGYGIRYIARQFDVDHTTIMKIRDGKLYTNISKDRTSTKGA